MLVTQADIGYFAGFRVISDSQVPVDRSTPGTPVYTTYLASSGVIRNVLSSRFASKLSATSSLQNTLAVTYNRCDHAVGTSWVAGAFASDPTNADLAEPTNWIAAYKDTRLIPIVAIQSLSSFASLDPTPRSRSILLLLQRLLTILRFLLLHLQPVKSWLSRHLDAALCS